MSVAKRWVAGLAFLALLVSLCGTASAASVQGGEAAVLPVHTVRAKTPARQLLAPVDEIGSKDFNEETVFRARFEGDTVSGTAETTQDGTYRISATETDGEAWHIKLESSLKTLPGRDYFITYRFRSDVAGAIKFGEFQEFQIVPGENTVTAVVVATGGDAYLDLQLGGLAPFNIEFTDIQIQEYTDKIETEDVLEGFQYDTEKSIYETHDRGYEQELIHGPDNVTMEFSEIPPDHEVWRSFLIARTDFVPQAGERYRISAQLLADRDMDFEACFDSGAIEKGYGAMYGQRLYAGVARPVCFFISMPESGANPGEVVIRFALGNAYADSSVRLSDVKVERVKDEYTDILPVGFALDKIVAVGDPWFEDVPVRFTPVPLHFSYSSSSTSFEGHDDGYRTRLEKAQSSVTYDIWQAPQSAEDRGVWKAKLYIDTGVVPEAGKSYRLSFDLEPTRDQAEYEICFDGANAENAYGALYGRSFRAGQTDHVVYNITPEKSAGKLVLRIQLGKTDTAAGNRVTFRNLRLEELNVAETDVLPGQFSYETVTTTSEPGTQTVVDGYEDLLTDGFSYQTGVNVWEEHADGYTQSVSASGREATLSITGAPAEGRDLWNAKLMINTGFVPQPGVRYAVLFDLTARDEQPRYEICLDGDSENAYGALYDLSLPAGATQNVRCVFTPEQSQGPLVLRFQLGQTATEAGNEIKVQNLKIVEVSAAASDVTPEDFVYPTLTVTPGEMEEAGYYSVELPDLSYSEAHDDGYEQTLEGTKLHVTAVPTLNNGVWCSKLFVDTGFTPEPNTTYRLTVKVRSDKGMDYELCLNSGDEEKGYGALYGQHAAAGEEAVLVQSITAPETPGKLVLQFMLGKSPAENTFSVEEVTLEKFIPEHEEQTETPEGYQEKALDNLTATEAHDDGYVQTLEGTTLQVTAVPTLDNGVWCSKLFVDTGFTPEPNTTYRITAEIQSDKALDFELCLNKGDQEKGYGALYGQHAAAGEQTALIYNLEPDQNPGKLVLQFMLGKSPAENTFAVRKVTVEKYVPAHQQTNTIPAGYQDKAIAGLSAAEGHDPGYEQTLDGLTLTVTAVPGDPGVWKSKVFVDTQTTLETGKKYRVTANITSQQAMDFEICLNNGSAEKGYGAMYGLHAPAGTAAGYVSEFTVGEDVTPANLVLQLQLGNTPAPNTITVHSVKLEQWEDEHTETVNVPAAYVPVELPALQAWEGHDDGYDQSVEGTALVIRAVPTLGTGVWSSKLFVDTNTPLEAGKKYRLTANITSQQAMDFELLCNNGSIEKGYGALYGQQAPAGEAKDYVCEFTVGADVTAENLVLQLQLGNTPAPNTIAVNSLKLEQWEDVGSETVVVPESYAPVELPALQASEGHDDGYDQSVEGTALVIRAVPTLENGVWCSRLFAATGFTPAAGTKYRVQLTLRAMAAMDFELLCNNGPEEKGYGALYGQHIEAGEVKTLTCEFTVPEDAVTKELVVQLQLGGTPAPNDITVEQLQVDRWSDGGKAPDTQTLAPGSFELWAHETYAASLGGDGSEAVVEFQAVPEEGREAWKTKLFAETGLTLKAGTAYRISVDVQADSALDYEICYNDGAVEKGVGALYGLNAGPEKHTVVFEATPEADAQLIVQFSLGNAAAGNRVRIHNLTVEELVQTDGEDRMEDSLIAWSPVHVWADAGYTADLSNTDSGATLKIHTVAADQADWKLKLFAETGVKLTAGKEYRVRYTLRTEQPLDFNVFYNNGTAEKELGEFYGLHDDGTMTVEHTLKPETDAELILQLMLGNSPAGNTLQLTDVHVEELQTHEEQTTITTQHPGPVNFWAHEDYQATISNTQDSASLAITSVPASGREAWKVKLFVETGAKLTAGKRYRVSLDVRAATDLDYEICYNNVEVEKALGARYGLHAGPETQTVTYELSADQDAELILQLNLGNAANATTVTVSGLRVEELTDSVRKELATALRFDSTSYVDLAADDGYQVTLDKGADTALLSILHAPAERNPWNVKLSVKTGFVPRPGRVYQVSFELEAAKPQSLFEVFYDGAKEAGYGALYERSLHAGRNTVVSDLLRADNSSGELVIQIRLGKTNSTDGNVYRIRNVRVSEVAVRSAARYNSGPAADLWAHEDYVAHIERTATDATVRLENEPENPEAWKVKLFLNTRAPFEAGQKYRVSLEVTSEREADYEICYNRDGVEKGYGARYSLKAGPETQKVEYVTYAGQDGHLAVQLNLGLIGAENTFHIANLKVEKAGTILPMGEFVGALPQ